jgi:hypothetical protein
VEKQSTQEISQKFRGRNSISSPLSVETLKSRKDKSEGGVVE